MCAVQASQYSVGGPQTGQLPSYEAIVAHQQALGQHVQRLTDELAKLRRSGSRRADGDHTLLSRKPLSGYMCAPPHHSAMHTVQDLMST